MHISRAEKIHRHLPDYLSGLRQKVFMRKELLNIVQSHQAEWGLSASISQFEILSILDNEPIIQKIALEFPNRTETRYLFDKPTAYEIAASIHQAGYLSHHCPVIT